MRNHYIFLSILALASIAFGACNKDEKAPLNIPAAYDGANFAANTANEDLYRNRLETLVAEAKKGRTAGTVLTYIDLIIWYDGGIPTLQSITTPYYDQRLRDTGGWLKELPKASGGAYLPGPPTGEGGVYGGYLFDENGLELEQMVEKGLFGAALYNYAITQLNQVLTPAIVDQMVRIYGAHPDFPNTPTAAKAANPDKFMANYAARRDKNDGTGLYFQMKNAFIKLQAAVKAGADYNKERDEALATIRETWEKINAATIINYCHSVIGTMSATNPTDADKAAALHAYGECVGFMHGWRTIPQAYKKISDAEIDEILTLLNAPYDNIPTSYLFVTDPLNQLPKLTQIINKLKNKYGFSTQEIEDFKNNWVAVQGR